MISEEMISTALGAFAFVGVMAGLFAIAWVIDRAIICLGALHLFDRWGR